jgi:glycine/D-amino acid oxidase-like deaminating enzyme
MNTQPIQSPSPVRGAVVGAGNVGATFAYALLLSGLASEIVLIDKNRPKAALTSAGRDAARSLRQKRRYLPCRRSRGRSS